MFVEVDAVLLASNVFVLTSIIQRPKCPQVDIDVRHLLRIPEDYHIDEEPEDEFECLNLDVTVPAETAAGQNLPVFIWIYGKHQVSHVFGIPGPNACAFYRWLASSHVLLRCIRHMW